MTARSLPILVVSTAFASNLVMMQAVRALSPSLALVVCVALILVTFGLLARGLLLEEVSGTVKLSLALASVFSGGLMSLSWLVNAANVDLNTTQPFQILLIVSFIGAVCSGAAGYLLKDT